jgi:hypothetical protein
MVSLNPRRGRRAMKKGTNMHPEQSVSLEALILLDRYFLETRAKLLDIAATLDRLDRAPGAPPPPPHPPPPTEPRLHFIQDALTILAGNAPNRAEQIQQRYSLP